ncbi:hypothetical protein Tsubulata_012905, partial [Turnera subulata]
MTARNTTPKTNTEFIRTSCSTTTYPKLCYSSLSIHAGKIQSSPQLLANAALNVSLSSAKSTSSMMLQLSHGQGMKPREVSAMSDCVEELSDSVDELRRSIDEMSSSAKRLTDFQLMINNVQTWVSAALTDESTCSDGFEGNAMNGKLKTTVRGKIVNIAQLTSNALSLMASLSSNNSFDKFLFVFIAMSLCINSSSATRSLIPETSTEFIRTSCSTTTYPRLCYTSLSIHASKIQTSPKLLANAALNETLSSTKSTSSMMLQLSQGHDMKPREVSAMRDCIEELSDAVDELRKSIEQMTSTKGPNFQIMINDVQTWVSAAMTDESTCSDGFAGSAMNGNLKAAVRGRIVTVAQLTSNALALINNYASIH